MDYGRLGLKCGIEVHQQLDTGKLFSRSPSLLRDDEPKLRVRRMLRAVAGEKGDIDIAAVHEQEKGMGFIYEVHDTVSLVELDEEPPQPIDKEALSIALQAALMLKCGIVDYMQVMRKTVVDGSNTTGFQRTAIVAHGGYIDTSKGKVSVRTVCIEEDSARKISENENAVTYRLDRLGIPLIEIATGPDIISPEHCMETAEKLGALLRSTGRVKRGLGTIRQDVNVSINGGTRVEIKGAQELRMLPTIVEYEALRQVSLLKIKDGLAKNKVKKSSLKKELSDLSGLFEKTSSSLVRNSLAKGGVVLGIRLSGFAGFIGRELQPGSRLGTEFSQHAKAKAGVGGIFHSDELPAYGITESEVAKVKEKLKCGKKDAFVLVAAENQKAEAALAAVLDRAFFVFDGVPAEVRNAKPDGTTAYLRPMPGAARMYPETDHPLISPDVRNIMLPELIENKIKRFVKEYRLSEDLAHFVAGSERAMLFDELSARYKKMKPSFIAETLTATMREIKRDYAIDPGTISDDMLKELFSMLEGGKISKDMILSAIVGMAKGEFDASKYQKISKGDIEKQVKEIISRNKGAPFGALMGIAMKQLKGKAGGKEIAQVLNEIMKKGL